MSERAEIESAQLRHFRAEFQANPALCERALAVLGEPAPEPERVLIRTDAESVDLALARALALAVNGTVCRVECDT
jgi:hypothetical protein